MALAPRAVVVHRRTEYEELLARHGTSGQAEFFLASRGRTLAEVVDRHEAVGEALTRVAADIPVDWRRGLVERADLSRFLFAPEDIVVVVGQDGLVANVAKYLSGQPVVGVNADPAVNPGVLVPTDVADFAGVLASVAAGRATVEHRTMVVAVTDDGQQLLALNEIYVGHPSHQSARYRLTLPDGRSERQSSSGVLIGTGTGASGWCRSAAQERQSTVPLPGPTAPALAWFVREAWPSPQTGTACTQGILDAAESLTLSSESDGLVVFGDGIESDLVPLAWGQQVEVRRAQQTLALVLPR